MFIIALWLDVVHVHFFLDCKHNPPSGILALEGAILEEESLIGVREQLPVALDLVHAEHCDDFVSGSSQPRLGEHHETVDVHPHRLLRLPSQSAPHGHDLLDRLHAPGFNPVFQLRDQVEDLHAPAPHPAQDSSHVDAIGLLILLVVVQEVINELPVVTSLGALTVALSAVGGTSGQIARHCVCVESGNTGSCPRRRRIRFGALKTNRSSRFSEPVCLDSTEIRWTNSIPAPMWRRFA